MSIHLAKLESIYLTHTQRYQSFVRSAFSLRDDTAEDIVQTAFLHALERLHLYDPEHGTMEAWLTRITRNAAIDHLRARRSSSRRPLPLDEGIELIYEPPSSDFDVEKLLLHLDRLPAHYRSVVRGRMEGHTPEEIASQLGHSAATVTSRYYQAISMLRRELSTEVL
jgi:RNA polymerase sigma-70 factor (ECF subfamily)